MKPVKRNGKRLLALTLALLLCAALLPTAALAETYSGTTVRLEKTEGTVTVKNAAGEVKSLSGRPRLSGGWTVKTEAASYAWLSFDADSGNTLSVKLDANTLVEVRKNGGKNEVLLKNNGRLIAGSEKPLSGGQTLSVGNSSGVCGVRGSLLLATDDQFMFLFGHGVAVGRDGAAQKTELAAGQGVAYGAGGSMRRFEVQTAQISGFAQVELADNPALAQQMYEQTAGRLDLRNLTMEQAIQQQRTDEARAALLRSGFAAGGGLSVPGGSRLRLDPAWGEKGLVNKSTTVYFYANGGTGYMAPVTVTSALQVPACEFTRDGYTFTGWKDDYGNDHPIGSSIQGGASGTFAELTLYAQWQANNPGGWNVLPYVPAPDPEPKPEPKPEPTNYTITVPSDINCKVEAEDVTYETDDENTVYTVAKDALAALTYIGEPDPTSRQLYGLSAYDDQESTVTLMPGTLTFLEEGNSFSFTCTYSYQAAENITLTESSVLYSLSDQSESLSDAIICSNALKRDLGDGFSEYYATAGTQVGFTFSDAYDTGKDCYLGLAAYRIGDDASAGVRIAPLTKALTHSGDACIYSCTYEMPDGNVSVSRVKLYALTVEESEGVSMTCDCAKLEDMFYAVADETVTLTVTYPDETAPPNLSIKAVRDSDASAEQSLTVDWSEDKRTGTFQMPDAPVKVYCNWSV